MNTLLQYLPVPGRWVNDIVHITGIGLVQYAVGLLVILVAFLFATILAARWRGERHLIFLIGSLLTLAGGGIFALATVTYASAWVYTGLTALIFLDIIWQTVRRQKGLRTITLTWAVIGCVVAVLTFGGTWLTSHLTEGHGNTTLSTNTTYALGQIQNLKESSMKSVEKVASTDISTLNLTSSAVQEKLNFLIIGTSSGAVLASSANAPQINQIDSGSYVTVDGRGIPTVVSTTTTANGTRVTGGVFLDATHLGLLKISGGITSLYGLESSNGLQGAELLTAGSADTRTWLADNQPHTFSTETSTDRIFLKSTVIDPVDNLSFVTVATDHYAVQRQHGTYAIVILAIAALITLLALFLRPLHRIIAPIAVLAGIGCILVATYATWVTLAYTALHTTYPLAAIQIDHPALTPHIYFFQSSTGVSIQVDTTGANIAEISGHFLLPAGISTADVVLNPEFCTTVPQAARVSANILSFSCGTANPPLRNTQIGTIARITASVDILASGSVRLEDGFALARTGETSTERLPLRADPFVAKASQ